MKKKFDLVVYIKKLRLFRVFKIVTSKVVLPGFDGLPLYDVIVFFFKGLMDGAITTRASSIAFKFFLALFPAILFLFTLIPYIPIAHFQITLLDTIHASVPENFYVLISSTITDIVSRQHGGLLSFGVIMALYFASNGILGVIVAFNKTAHSIETRKWWQQYLISIALMVILSMIVMVSISLILLGTMGLKYLITAHILKKTLVVYLIKYGRWLVVLLMVFFGASFLYYLAPAKRQRFRFISAGSTLATLLFILTTSGFNYYVNNFAKYNALYGSIGTIIVIMMWLYFNSISLLVGFELNASIAIAKKSMAMKT
ncbi:MAG: YihY/virulence factor BrkB family protein [Bacteroidota bacterium]